MTIDNIIGYGISYIGMALIIATPIAIITLSILYAIKRHKEKKQAQH